MPTPTTQPRTRPPPVLPENTDGRPRSGRSRRTRFFPVSVFDLAQTDPIEGAEPIPENPADAHQLSGDDPAGIAEAVTDWLTGQGWAIEHNQLGAGLNGFTSPDDKRIVIGLFSDEGVGVV